MRSRVIAVIGLLLAVGIPAGAEPPPQCNISEAGPDNPHVLDALNDWEGIVTGNQGAIIPSGDVYREATDIDRAWLEFGSNGALRAAIKVQDLGSGAMVNAIFYLHWTYKGSDESKQRRWASALFKGTDVAYRYGYKTVSTIPGSSEKLETIGATTGQVDLANDTIYIDLPAGTDWGSPTPGSIIPVDTAESRLLLGSPEQLPNNPLGLKHGFVYLVDQGEAVCQAVVA